MLAGIFACGMMLMAQEEQKNSDYQFALIEAVKQKNLGNLPEAAKLYSLVIKEKPDCAVAHYELGGIYMSTQQYQLAVQHLGRSYALDKESYWYGMAYVQALGASRDFETMEDILHEKIETDPGNVDWEFELALAYLSQEKYKKALKTLDRIEKDNGFSGKVAMAKAGVYERQGKNEEALDELDRVIAVIPEELSLKLQAAELCKRMEWKDSAMVYYQEVLLADSMNVTANASLHDYYVEKGQYGKSIPYMARIFENRQQDVGMKLSQMNSYMSSEEFIAKYPMQTALLMGILVRVHPEQPEVRLMASDLYIRLEEYDKAYMNLKAFLKDNNGTYAAYMQAIMLANAASLEEELMLVTEEALRYYPDSADIRFFRGLGLYASGSWEELLINFDSISPGSFSNKAYESQSRILFAEACYRLERYEKSDSIYEVIIREEPDNYMVLNNYSYYLAERGERLEEAERWSRIAIDNNPDNATFLDTYAWVLFKMGDYVGAEKYILMALEKGAENDPEVNEHAGDIQAALNSIVLAKSYYLKAIVVGGDRERLDNKIKRMNEGLDE